MTEPNSNPTAGFDFNHPTIVALLYLASWLTGGLTGIVGIVLAYVWRGESVGGWETSHTASTFAPSGSPLPRASFR